MSATRGPRPPRSAARSLDQGPVDVDPARLDLHAESPPRAAGDGRSEQRPADSGEGIENQVAGPREELDQARHEPGRLVRPMLLAHGMAELRRVGRAPDGFGEVEPFLAREFVEGVVGVSGAHPASLSHLHGRPQAYCPPIVSAFRRPTAPGVSPAIVPAPRPSPTAPPSLRSIDSHPTAADGTKGPPARKTPAGYPKVRLRVDRALRSAVPALGPRRNDHDKPRPRRRRPHRRRTLAASAALERPFRRS